MSDPEVHKPEKPADVDDVVGSANAGLDAAAAAGADVPGTAPDSTESKPVDPDLAAFEEAEREHPGLFSSPTPAESGSTSAGATDYSDADTTAAFVPPVSRHDDATASYDRVSSYDREDTAVADTAYAPSADLTETRIVPSEPLVAASAQAPQPIFVQAPEPPRDRGNRGTAGAIGLLATVAFAVLYLGATIGFGAIAGDVTGQNIGEALVAPLLTWGYWTPVVVFFLGFWLLGAIINRGRWGLWVVFGIVVGVIAYAGHILGQLFEAPFWKLTASEGLDLVGSQLLAPLAIAAFVFARELTIWFGAWVARSGARKTEYNAEAQREYERTLEAGPTLAR
ncbi:ABC transporter [Microbacterium sp. TPD7012]|uniref:ABC transporter n=1 Tax=Microbacterium sp. TPD7012 TaxID=2171975 RepID=UPI000D509CC7|nr:ABC transporter [Microbacterium sp. TPD7012]PVE94806.1 ABC transporter [Microbacterium sp. TPD7012]